MEVLADEPLRKVIGGNYMLKKFWAYLKDESGQTSTEYILLVAVVALIVFKFKKTAETRLDALTNGVFNKADDFLKETN